MRAPLRYLPTCLALAGVVALIGVPIGWYTRGGPGAGGVLAGVGLVTVSYLLSAGVAVWADSVDRRMLFPMVMITYVLKLVIFGAVFFPLAKAGWPGVMPMAVAVVVLAIGWPLAQLWWILRAKLPYVDVDLSPPRSRD